MEDLFFQFANYLSSLVRPILGLSWWLKIPLLIMLLALWGVIVLMVFVLVLAAIYTIFAVIEKVFLFFWRKCKRG